MTDKKRTWITTIAGLIAVIVIVFLSPAPVYQARGILLPAQKTRPPISPDSVVQLSNRPFGGQIMGYINIERHYPAPGRQAHKDIAQLAQNLSAQVGANAFVVTLFRIGQITSTKYIYVFQATAYYAPMVQSAMEFPFQ